MARTVNIAQKLRKIAASLEELASAIEVQGIQRTASAKSGRVRTRRSKKEVAELKKLLKTGRKQGVPVAELAAKHGVSTAYIYMLQ